MISDFDVYASYRRVQSIVKDKPYRLPKDWQSYKTTRMNEQNRKWLEQASMYFSTTYSNIDIDEYMSCGFELFKGFTYKNLLDPKVINHYIHKDKVKKRRLETQKEEILDTFHDIRSIMHHSPCREGYNKLQSFCKLYDGEQKIIINRYIKGKIDAMTLVYCIIKKYIVLSDDDRALIPYIVKRYRELVEKMNEVKHIIQDEERKLG